MTETDSDRVKFYRSFLLLMVVAISALFFTMIRDFLMTLLLAAIFSGLAYPLYRRLNKKLGDRKVLASATTILIAILVVVIPLTALLGLIANEAFQISQVVKPWIQEQISQSSGVAERLPAWAQPWLERLNPFRDQILEKTGEITGMAGNFLFKSLSATTRGTVSFFLHLFVMLYAMFFFLMDGPALIQKVRSFLPLRESDKDLMEERFMSVTRATIKGTFAIGAIQGLLGGVGFAVAGIQGSIFWAALMGVLSVIPGVGAAIVWAPAGDLSVGDGRYLRGSRLAGLVCGRRRDRRQRPATPIGGQGRQDARSADPAEHPRRHRHVRGGGLHHRADRGGPLSHHLGHVWCGLSGRATARDLSQWPGR